MLINSWCDKWIGLEPTSQGVYDMARAAEKIAGNWYNNRRSSIKLIICGNPGIGKTHVLTKLHHWARALSTDAYIKRHWQYPPSVVYSKWPVVCSGFIQRDFSALDDMFTTDLLLLDDIGAENDPWKIATDKLCQVLSAREISFSVITTNIQPSDWDTRWDRRVADRLMRRSVVLTVDAESYSTTKRQIDCAESETGLQQSGISKLIPNHTQDIKAAKNEYER